MLEEVRPLVLDGNQREVAITEIRNSIQRTHLLFHVDGLEKNPYVPDPFAPRLNTIISFNSHSLCFI